MATTDLTASTFPATVTQPGIVLVDFWASWCGPCRTFGPIFERVSDKHPDVTFGKVDTEQEEELAGGLGIRSIPTLMVFRDGVLLYAQPGMVPEEGLDDIIRQARALDMDEVRREVEAQLAKVDEKH